MYLLWGKSAYLPISQHCTFSKVPRRSAAARSIGRMATQKVTVDGRSSDTQWKCISSPMHESHSLLVHTSNEVDNPVFPSLSIPNSLQTSQDIYCSEGINLTGSQRSVDARAPVYKSTRRSVAARATDHPGDLQQPRGIEAKLYTDSHKPANTREKPDGKMQIQDLKQQKPIYFDTIRTQHFLHSKS